MSNIHLKVTIEKNWGSQNFFWVQKISHQVSVWEVPAHTDIIEFQNFLLQLKNKRSGSKTLCSFSIILIWNYDVLKSKCTCAS